MFSRKDVARCGSGRRYTAMPPVKNRAPGVMGDCESWRSLAPHRPSQRISECARWWCCVFCGWLSGVGECLLAPQLHRRYGGRDGGGQRLQLRFFMLPGTLVCSRYDFEPAHLMSRPDLTYAVYLRASLETYIPQLSMHAAYFGMTLAGVRHVVVYPQIPHTTQAKHNSQPGIEQAVECTDESSEKG